MKILRLLRAGFDSAANTDRLYGGTYGGGNWLLGGADYDYKRGAGKGYDNSAVMACLRFYAPKFSQAKLKLATLDKDEKVIFGKGNAEAQGLIEAINNPNPFYSNSQLWWATLVSLAVSEKGAFWYRLKNRGGQTVGLYYLNHNMVTARDDGPTQDGRKIITHFDVNFATGHTRAIPYEDIVHFRWALDIDDPKFSYAPLAPILREVCSDNEAATFTSALLRNGGVPGFMISPDIKDGMPPSQDFMDRVKEDIDKLTRENRGRTLGFRVPMKISQLGWEPDKMVLDKVRNMSSDRICAAFGLDPMAVNLPSQSKTYSNVEEAKRSAIEDAVMPLMDDVAQQATTQLLLPVSGTENMSLRFDYAGIPAISRIAQEKDEKAREMDRKDFAADKLTRAEFRERGGLKKRPGDDVYFSEIKAANTTLPATLNAERALLQKALEQ